MFSLSPLLFENAFFCSAPWITYKQMLIRGVLVSAVRSRQSYLALQRGATGSGPYPSHQHHDRSSASRADGICRWPELSFMLAACRGDTEPKDMPDHKHRPWFAVSENTTVINLRAVLPTRIRTTAGNTQDMELMQKQHTEAVYLNSFSG